MKATIAGCCFILCSAATMPAAEAAQIKTATVTPHVTISHTNLAAHGAGGGGGAGKVTFSPITVTKQTDSASPTFFRTASSTGGGGAGKTTASPYLRYQFKQVNVKTISWAH